MIKVSQLSKHFGTVKAVDDISFEVREGETLALLGTSGCGKTTTLKTLNRLIEPSAGTIEIAGQNILQQQPETLRRSMGYVLQNTGLFPHYTIAENIAVVPQLQGWDKTKTDARARELMEKLHLSPDLLSAYPRQLSGGQQQRVGLARALAADPPILLMDEPFGALDNVTRTKIQAEFKQLDELTRKTIIMVTHDVQEAFDLADRICLMDKGRIVQLGAPADLLFKPANTFVKEFLAGQQMQLELRTTNINNLWELLPDVPALSAAFMPKSTTVWALMEILKNQPAISFQKNKQVKTINFEQLMSAFYQYRKGGYSHE
ncbi:osmoprotectant transport system ATP-binding protein [Mucilaginibacter yixingensis]|uniref:Osmoprotectant transport system ATP-binding protein n=1 Tax=Mucilaginibacter yixingensis TaxID=1295612 RepID=A0A2T5JD53_9SPHI|nr:ABC transporter ATP-binding protein [Mucilaginibacter yixingensis]PTQ99697.1 osmoprotectant transport system ATP-binding protein [Mucilaginibacter yixingensis]